MVFYAKMGSEKGEFDIVKSPYCEIGNEEWQNKYAGFEYSCKQFM